MPASHHQAVRELDHIFLEVFKALNLEVIKISGAAAEQILKLSSGFLSEQALKAVGQFHSLYFGSGAVEKNKTEVNLDVDRLISDIQVEISNGSTDDAIGKAVQENLSLKEARLRLSAVQKDLETMIRLDQGVKEKLMPVLSSLQFEDMIRQRLEHTVFAWESVVHNIDENSILDVQHLAAEIEAKLSSTAEQALFYKTVLKKDPPAGGIESGSLFFEF